MKVCSKCHIEKPICDFFKKAHGRYGVAAICKVCRKIERTASLSITLDSRRIQARKWAARNKHRLAAAASRWQKKHPGRANANTAAYEARKIRAMPKWTNRFFIEEIYDLAARRTALKTGGIEKWQVDHIVPLQSNLVCGLHVEHNLRVISASKNSSKKNYYWPDMP